MIRNLFRAAFLALLIGMASEASAQTTVPIPDQSQTSTLTATVGEQCRINVPAVISFPVTNVSLATNAGATVIVDTIVLANATRRLRVLVRAVSASFTPPFIGDSTWLTSDVTWNAATWQNGTGYAGILTNAVFVRIAESNANVPNIQSTGLTFTLAGRSNVRRAGNHTLNMTWRVEAF